MLDYKTAVQKLYGLELFGIKLGLQNLTKLLSLLGNPHNGLKFIHVAGTNGKGSVCAILSKVLEKAKFNVGFFSSPHLVTIRERFRFNNQGITENELSSLIEEVWPIIDNLYAKGVKITFFEATVAIALIYYSRKKCDFVIWETGMGGRLDGTNVVDPIATAIVTIDYDHQQYLGATLEEIAFEKAGIIKKGIPLFLGDIQKEPLEVITKKAKELDSEVFKYNENLLSYVEMENDSMRGWKFSICGDSCSGGFTLSLSGRYQPHNMIVAYSILKYLSKRYSFNLFQSLSGLNGIIWHARCQTLPDGKILDGAHNKAGFEALVLSIKKSYPKTKFTVIFGCLEERDPKNAILELSKIADRFIFTPIKTNNRKSCEPQKVIELIRSIEGVSAECISAQSAKDALALAGNSRTLIAGSLYMAGEILSQYYTEDEITTI